MSSSAPAPRRRRTAIVRARVAAGVAHRLLQQAQQVQGGAGAERDLAIARGGVEFECDARSLQLFAQAPLEGQQRLRQRRFRHIQCIHHQAQVGEARRDRLLDPLARRIAVAQLHLQAEQAAADAVVHVAHDALALVERGVPGEQGFLALVHGGELRLARGQALGQNRVGVRDHAPRERRFARQRGHHPQPQQQPGQRRGIEGQWQRRQERDVQLERSIGGVDQQRGQADHQHHALRPVSTAFARQRAHQQQHAADAGQRGGGEAQRRERPQPLPRIDPAAHRQRSGGDHEGLRREPAPAERPAQPLRRRDLVRDVVRRGAGQRIGERVVGEDGGLARDRERRRERHRVAADGPGDQQHDQRPHAGPVLGRPVHDQAQQGGEQQDADRDQRQVDVEQLAVSEGPRDRFRRPDLELGEHVGEPLAGDQHRGEVLAGAQLGRRQHVEHRLPAGATAEVVERHVGLDDRAVEADLLDRAARAEVQREVAPRIVDLERDLEAHLRGRTVQPRLVVGVGLVAGAQARCIGGRAPGGVERHVLHPRPRLHGRRTRRAFRGGDRQPEQHLRGEQRRDRPSRGDRPARPSGGARGHGLPSVIRPCCTARNTASERDPAASLG